MSRIKILGWAFMTAAAVALTASAQSPGPTMEEILGHYQKIQQSLAADSLSGVKAEAQAIVEKAEAMLKQESDFKEKSAIELKKILAETREAARKLDSEDINKARVAFSDLSQALVRYVKDFQAGKEKYYIAYCPMAKKSWVQTEKAIKNPYYGKSMLTCGTIVAK